MPIVTVTVGSKAVCGHREAQVLQGDTAGTGGVEELVS